MPRQNRRSRSAPQWLSGFRLYVCSTGRFLLFWTSAGFRQLPIQRLANIWYWNLIGQLSQGRNSPVWPLVGYVFILYEIDKRLTSKHSGTDNILQWPFIISIDKQWNKFFVSFFRCRDRPAKIVKNELALQPFRGFFFCDIEIVTGPHILWPQRGRDTPTNWHGF